MRVVGCRSTLSSASDPKKKFEHVPRFCYRKCFSPILNTKITSDKGWGCCFRCTQGIIGQFIYRLHNQYKTDYDRVFGQDCDPSSLFFDTPEAPFSIHNLVKNSIEFGLEPGTWAKPSIAAAAIQRIFGELHLGCVLCHDFCITKSEMDISFPAIFLVPGLFGLDSLDLSFIPFLHAAICIQGSLGFVSGKRNSAYYIAGLDSDKFIYFDPHTTMPALLRVEDKSSLFSIKPRTIRFRAINPSILIGFMCTSTSDLDNVIETMMSINSSPIDVNEPSDAAMAQVLDIDDLDLDGE
ncbi:Clan CA, family C54, ATG4-like cysteine peptidase [Tritrichomonas foetus]|uniref:Cysteine protease n=1 Tax=Tritrichomonas foetus TaxID=1144522 RepID=A0A1J4L147_9EUKA|nr:Clan CA, family C54, ATG4-like cysteine peptidase [Tritrichomonas foetus]|eukprot:OHT17138.1 Clan CA, family C54, ATG4-like cysteine peptidase [Tritrichomonas foetus]